jgi:SAM-dependent methyltransferase
MSSSRVATFSATATEYADTVGRALRPVAERVAHLAELRPGQDVLDVGTGTGNAALAAARFGCDVVGIDYVPALLERGRRRADAEGLSVDLREGDAEALPFDDGSFDAVVSIYGAMFAPDQEGTARELLRVTRPGGKIGMANWVPDGFVGDVFRTTAKHAPMPPGLTPPVAWGTEARLRELFGDEISDLRVERRVCTQRFRSVDHFLTFFRTYFGPTIAAFERVGADGQEALAADLEAVAAQYNRGGDRAAIRADYLEVVVVRA